MLSVVECCEQLCEYFAKLFELSEDQAGLYREARKAIKDKAWSPLNRNLERMELLAREQGRISKQILELRIGLQNLLQPDRESLQDPPRLWKFSELLPLLPAEQRARVRKIWQELRNNLVHRQSELQVLRYYSQEKQEMIEGFLAALKDDELDLGQVYSRGGGRYQSGAAAPARIFNGEA
ncbi:hypothetical protein P0082_06515 [Candidatus Haliotispira prima]|uniref:Flagellar protein FlgN n=1 Tax=Candidatus Haliotispira prima TaxID=3034016 RepID=A0ABY8MDT0_9SPIO|nr:hypothetical protein P0082_06515 [Candidatus Haliotispira prima]